MGADDTSGKETSVETGRVTGFLHDDTCWVRVETDQGQVHEAIDRTAFPGAGVGDPVIINYDERNPTVKKVE